MEKHKKDISKQKIAIIGIAFVIGLALMTFGGAEHSRSPEDEGELTKYRTELEDKLEELCRAVTGQEAQVIVSLEGGFSYRYALDSRGGVVTVGSGSSREALVESVSMPKISGVGVVCSCDSLEKRMLTELICSSLGIGSNRIFIGDAKKMSGQS